MNKPLRYIHNKATGVYHDRAFLTEACNTDSLEADREDTDTRPQNATLCQHCRDQQALEEGYVGAQR